MRLYLVLLALATTTGAAQTVTTLTYFNSTSTTGENPNSELVQGPDGYLYGTDEPLLYRSTLSGEISAVLPASSAISYFQYPLVGSDGFLYANNVYVNGTETAVESRVSPSNGALGELTSMATEYVQGSDGNFYGTTSKGGAFGDGTIFRVSTSGAYTLLYSFTGESDGGTPAPYLVQGTDGNFYGVTTNGGNYTNCPFNGAVGGCGTVFSISLDGSLKTLYTFSGGADGINPTFGIVEGKDGAFYGITEAGGSSNSCTDTGGYSGCGTIFRVTSSQAFSVIYNSASAFQFSSLYAATDGNLYGTTVGNDFPGNGGTIFEESISGGSYATLYTFNANGGGNQPNPLNQGSDGNFYGTTVNGGYNYPYGILYRLTPAQALKPPVQLSGPSSGTLGSPATFDFTVNNAYSLTQRQCFAYLVASGNFIPIGKLSGSYNSSTALYTGSFTVIPQQSGAVNYGVTCGNIDSATASLAVPATTKAPTSTTLSASASTVYPGQQVTLTATVKRTGSAGTPGGTVTIFVNGSAVGTIPVNSAGVASYTASTSGLPVNGYILYAEYNGDANDEASYSSATGVTLAAPIATLTTVAAGPNPVTRPGPCTLVARVEISSETMAVIPTGSVTFSAAGQTIATVPLDSTGIAQTTASSGGVPAGTYVVTATYNPTPAFTSSSGQVSVTVVNSSQVQR